MIHNQKDYFLEGLDPAEDPDYIDSIDAGKVELDGKIFWIKIYGGESNPPHFHLENRENNEEYCFELYNPRYCDHDGKISNRLSPENLCKLNEAMHGLNFAAAEHYGSSKLNVWEECLRWYFELEDHYSNTNPTDMIPANPIQPDYSKIEN